MRLPDLIRYGIWGGILATAEANRREYAMTTTWLPHLLTNSFTLLLPDLYRTLDPRVPAPEVEAELRQREPEAEWRRVLRGTVEAMVRDNPRYVVYMAPLAAGYLLSHPRFNIYKGALGEKRLAGFGLDALPHSATAFALTALICDTLRTAAELAPPEGALADALAWCDEHQELISGLALAAATLIWELGEYKIYRHELAQRGDQRKINMQWSASDTLADCAANLIGWGASIAWPRASKRAKRVPQHTSGDRQAA
jgi:hypothetical protein